MSVGPLPCLRSDKRRSVALTPPGLAEEDPGAGELMHPELEQDLPG